MAALATAAIALYAPLLFGRALADYDAVLFFLPQRAYLGQALREGRLPLWDPDLFMGAPFLANPQTAVLYPPSWLFALGPTHVVYGVQLALHAFLAGASLWLCLRWTFDTGRVAATFGALAFAFGGYFVGQAGHLNQVSAAAWLPAVLLGVDRATVTRNGRWVVAAAAAFALQVLAGHPQVTYLTLWALAVFLAVRAPWSRPTELVRYGGTAGLVMLLGGLLAAPQILPTAELASLSMRGSASWQDSLALSVPRTLVARVLLPPFWIETANLEFPAYAGVTTLVFAVVGVAVGRRRVVAWAVALCAGALFLALGAYNPLAELLLRSVPGLGAFRVPERWLLLWLLGISVLAALGVDHVERGLGLAFVWRNRRKRLWLLLAGGGGALVWVAVYHAPLPLATLSTWLALALAAVACLAVAHRGRYHLASAALLGLLAGELWAAAAGQPIRQGPPAWQLDVPIPAADWVRTQGTGGRLLSVATRERRSALQQALEAAGQSDPGPSQRDAFVLARAREILAANSPLAQGVRGVDGYDGGLLPLPRFTRLAGLLSDGRPVRPDGVVQDAVSYTPPPRVLTLLGVRYLLADADGPDAAPGARSVQFGPVRVHDRGPGVASALLVLGARPADSDAAALSLMRSSDFDPDREVVLAATAAQPSNPAVATAPTRPVEPTSATPERWQARVSVPTDGYLLQREAWYPGWSARVDGHPVPVLRADVLFRAVPVPAGDHDVELTFEPGSFRAGLALGALGLLLAGLPCWRRDLP